MDFEGATDGVPAMPDGVLEAFPGARMPPFPARTEPRFQGLPVLRGEALANVRAIAVGGLILQVGEAARRRRLMLAESRLGVRQTWRVERPWRRMARRITVGDHPHLAQVLPLGTLRVA